MKYGYKDREWLEEVRGTQFGSAVIMFNIDGFQSMMKRKTVTEADMNALKVLKEMTAMIEEHMKEIKKV